MVITVNDAAEGPLIEDRVFDKKSHIFLDTRAMINLTSVKYLRKLKTGATLIEPNHYVLQGLTGNKINTTGKTKVLAFVDNLFRFEIKDVVVEKSTFPGDLLIGYDTLRVEDTALFLARGVTRFAFRFIPLINN